MLNSWLAEYISGMRNKKVAVIGIGVSNTPLIRFLVECGAVVTAFDRQTAEGLGERLEQLKDLPVRFVLGEDYLKNLEKFDYIFRTPGLRHDVPELVAAAEQGAVITSEMEVFFELCPCRIIGVTGSDGKTTTTTIIYEILKEHGYKCWLGGNIGQPLLDKVGAMKPDDMAIVELSSFQLHTMKKSADIAVVTNVSPNHLDIHKSMEEYVAAKENIFIHQDENCSLIVNYDNDITRKYGLKAENRSIFFSSRDSVKYGAVLRDGKLRYVDDTRNIEFMEPKEIMIPGMHNVENYLAAIGAVVDMVSPDAIRKVAAAFKGVEHRMEFVRELNGVKFYNDSIGTSPTRTKAALESFEQKVILIAGGYDKKISYDEMGRVIDEKVKRLLLIGQTACKIRNAYEKELERQGRSEGIPIEKYAALEEAVKAAYTGASEGDIVILSPASASFDMFRNFEERGRVFKNAVNSLS